MIGLEEHMELFKLIGEGLKNAAECMAIGGSAMLFYGMKSATKDVDIVFFSEKELDSMIGVLKESGFSEKLLERDKLKNGIPVVMHRGEERLDLFLNRVFHFTISQAMRERTRQKHEFKNLIIDVVSHEDVILLKSVTDRDGDRADVKNIIGKVSVNWDTIIQEARWQTENGNKAFSVYLFDFLEELFDSGVQIPKEVLRKVRKISEEEMLKVLKSGEYVNGRGKASADAFKRKSTFRLRSGNASSR